MNTPIGSLRQFMYLGANVSLKPAQLTGTRLMAAPGPNAGSRRLSTNIPGPGKIEQITRGGNSCDPS